MFSDSDSYKQFISISKFLNIAIIIIFPIVLLTILNFLLLCVLRQRANNLLLNGGDDHLSSK